MNFRTLIILAVVIFVLRALIAEPCEPCFLATGAIALIIAKQQVLHRRAIGILILAISCIGLFFDVRERIMDEQTIRAKARYFKELRENARPVENTNDNVRQSTN